MPIQDLADAFYEELRDVYSAEKQLVRALAKMAKKASTEELAAAFEEHRQETEQHVKRVEQAFEDTGKAARAKRCEAMAGLIEEANEVMKEKVDPEVLDAMMIGLAQKVEHYEIATYGTLCTWAKLLKYNNAKTLLGDNLKEEQQTDKKLTKLAGKINVAATAEASS